MALPGDSSDWRAISRHGVTLLNLDEPSADDVCWEGWAGCVAQVLRSGRLSVLAAELAQPRPGLTCAKLQPVTDQVQAALDPVESPVVAGADPSLRDGSDTTDDRDDSVGQRSDLAHERFSGAAATASPARTSRVEGLVMALATQPPEVLELLERIDDLVFTAIGGDDRALTELEVLWPTVVAELDPDLIEQLARAVSALCAIDLHRVPRRRHASHRAGRRGRSTCCACCSSQ